MTCVSITLKLTLGMILYQVVPLASKHKFVKDENEFFLSERFVASFYLEGLFGLNVHKLLYVLAFSK